MNSAIQIRDKMYPKKALDVSSDNRFDVQDASGFEKIIFKAGQGRRITVPRSYVQACRDNGVPYEFYWVVDSRYSYADHSGAIATFLNEFYTKTLWLDCEKPNQRMNDAMYQKTPYKGVRLIDDLAINLTDDVNLGIYTNQGFASLIYGFPEWFDAFPLWVAQYNDFIMKPTIPYPWASWHMWQYRESPDINYIKNE